MPSLSKNTSPRRPLEFSHGSGDMFWDTNGRSIIDMSSQTLNLLFGQVHPLITKEVFSTLLRYTFVDQDFISADHIEAIDNLSRLIPSELTSINLRMNDGSSAVECAVKQARRTTNRSKVLTTNGIYLGQNSQVIHFRGLGMRPFDILNGGSEDVIFAPLPFCRDSHDPCFCKMENGEAISEMIDNYSSSLACVLLDPIMISSGVIGGRNMQGLAKHVETKCKEKNIPLIFDECQTFGWVPKNTLASLWDIDVDMIVLGKGVAGGFPLSICATKPLFDNLNFGDADYTHGGHPASIAALKATCNLLLQKSEVDNFRLLCDTLNDIIAKEISSRRHNIVSRGVGLIRGIELRISDSQKKNAEMTKKVSDISLEEGVFVRNYENVLGIKPPRVVARNRLVLAIKKIFEVIDRVIASEV